MPTLNWIGKDKVATHHKDVAFHVLSHRYGYTAGQGETQAETGSGNMIIHGDNLVALKSLLPMYEGRVDCIYIDPPYNTGNEGWVYNDNVSDPHLSRWLGEVVGKEGEDLSRHDKWLCMMYPRLRLMRQLMSRGGAIFISIDDNECDNLRKICDEIFGTQCFVGNISWQRTYSPRNDSQGIVSEVEHLLVYSRCPGWSPRKLERTAQMDAKYKNPDNDVMPWTSGDPFATDARFHQGMVYAIQHPFTGELIYPVNANHWRYGQEEMLEIMNGWCPYHLEDIHDEAERARVCGIEAGEVRQGVKAIVLTRDAETSRAMARDVYDRGQWPRYYFTKGGLGGVRRKTYLQNVEGRVVTNLWPYAEVGHTDEAKKELKAIFGGTIPFDTPKPVRLIERVLQVAAGSGAIVLDSFAGSGTTAHAVLDMNRRDGGNRRFILIEMMDYASTVTAERVRRVVTGYPYKGRKEEEIYTKKLTPRNIANGAQLLAEAQAAADRVSDRYTTVSKPKVQDNCLKVMGTVVTDETMPGLGGSFDYYELGPALFGDDGLLNEAVGEDAIRQYVYYTETAQRLTRQRTAESRYLLDTWQGTAYYFYYEPEAMTVLDYDSPLHIAEEAELYVVYADACRLPEEYMRRQHLLFKKIPRDIRRF